MPGKPEPYPVSVQEVGLKLLLNGKKVFNNDSEVILHADRDFLLKNIRKISNDSFILKDGDKIPIVGILLG